MNPIFNGRIRIQLVSKFHVVIIIPDPDGVPVISRITVTATELEEISHPAITQVPSHHAWVGCHQRTAWGPNHWVWNLCSCPPMIMMSGIDGNHNITIWQMRSENDALRLWLRRSDTTVFQYDPTSDAYSRITMNRHQPAGQPI
jgi:hypothetical protein